MEELMDITTFYNKWHVQYMALIDAGGKLNELEQIEIFLGSIPNSKYLAIKAQFDLSEQIITISGEKQQNPLSMTYILDRIKMFDLVSGHSDKKASDESFFGQDKRKSNQKQKTENFNRNLVCFNCGGYGHKPLQCGSPKRPKDFCPTHLKEIIDSRSKKSKTESIGKHTSKVTTFEDTTYNTVDQTIMFDSNCLNKDFKSYLFLNYEINHAILDSGSNVNLLKDKKYFVLSKFTSYAKPKSLITYKGEIGDDGDILGEGPAIIYIKYESKISRIVLDRALLAPQSPYNIISEGFI